MPEGGGEPGKAYLAWVDAVHAGDVEAMKGMVPAEMAAELDGPEAAEALEFMALLMPKDIRIIGGSSDGSTAILSIEATMEGQAASGEVTMQHRDGFWMETGISIQ